MRLAPLFLSFVLAARSALFFLSPCSGCSRVGLAYEATDADPLLFFTAGGSDSPHKFNERIGANASVFQLTQDMPRPLHNADTGPWSFLKVSHRNFAGRLLAF